MRIAITNLPCLERFRNPQAIQSGPWFAATSVCEGTVLAGSLISMFEDDAWSAKRLGLGIGFVFLLWLVAGRFYSFAEQIKQQDRERKQTLEMLERNRQRDLAIIQQQHERFYGQPVPTPIPAKAARPNSGKNSHSKMVPSAVVNRLRRVNAFGLLAKPERRLHCMENQGDWDYICLFHPDPISNANWAQFGVLEGCSLSVQVADYP